MRPESKSTTFHLLTNGGASSLKRVSLEDHIKYTLRAAILTHEGERFLHPTLGSRVRDSLFRPLIAEIRTEIASQVSSAIQKSEPRVEVIDVEVAPDNVDKSKVLVQIKYRVLETRKVDNVRLAISP